MIDLAVASERRLSSDADLVEPVLQITEKDQHKQERITVVHRGCSTLTRAPTLNRPFGDSHTPTLNRPFGDSHTHTRIVL